MKKAMNKKSGTLDELHRLGNELINLVKSTKTKYHQADDKTKKAVLASIAGATVLIAGAIRYKKMRGKKRK